MHTQMHTPSFPWDPPAYEDAKPAEGGSPQWDKANHYHTLGRKTHTKAHIHFVLLIRKKERKKERKHPLLQSVSLFSPKYQCTSTL